jgi:hypothetical protein
MGDVAKRHTFICGRERCGAVHTFSNVTLLRYFLRAVSRNDDRVDLRTAPLATA